MEGDSDAIRIGGCIIFVPWLYSYSAEKYELHKSLKYTDRSVGQLTNKDG